jgi:hypothetical protein
MAREPTGGSFREGAAEVKQDYLQSFGARGEHSEMGPIPRDLKTPRDAVASGYSMQSTSTPPTAPPMLPVAAMPAPSIPNYPPMEKRSTVAIPADELRRRAGGS